MEIEYVILDLKKEYPGYTGTEKWMVITDLPMEELVTKCKDQIINWNEVVIMSNEMGREILRYKKNEFKHSMRIDRWEGPIAEETLSIPDEKVDIKFSNLWLQDALDSLTQSQKERVIRKYICGYSEKAIARHEGVNQSSVHKGIQRALDNIRKFSEADHTMREDVIDA